MCNSFRDFFLLYKYILELFPDLFMQNTKKVGEFVFRKKIYIYMIL